MSIYLDHAATTPMRPEALEALVAAHARVGNPASIHGPGQAARAVLEEARERVAGTVGADPIEVVFTSGGTESINLALKGLYWQRNTGAARPVILVPDGEHHATIDTAEWLATHERATIVAIPLDATGRIRTDAFAAALAEYGDAVACATAIWANNEVGTIQPVAELSRLATEAGVPLHLDAVAAYGHADIDLHALRTESRSGGNAGPVAISVSAHKIGGPIGIGALVLARSAAIEPLLHGGGQQRQVRSGTQDVPAAVAFAAAATVSEATRAEEHARLITLRDRLISGILAANPAATLSGLAGEERLDNNVHVAFPGAQGDSLLFLLDMAGLAVSTGSACQAGIPEPSHVLLAMGRDEDAARSVLRFTLGHTSTEAEVDACIAALPAAYASAARAGLSSRSV
ncbi:cysteine desulfurase [Mycetocola lacteus]|uniref:Cysteine desulfurase n=1 Tax=Mycetocola lacteus TaxID=76637 RepID=A0A3L7API1_9MICO|nr:cysteine desulfurase family protein [Mycetocola lacteus]RLP82413.1 cysteine desulfurase [Mycetocola lacteus]